MTPKKVAFLATGDEIIMGQVINTNAPTMAEQLINAGIDVGNHATATDAEENIIHLIHFLLESHDALIITGGLGPTSDDRTRQALSLATKKDLVFDPDSWAFVTQRLHSFGLSAPESNKQQAYFPKGATIIENNNGTARGCFMNVHQKIIFMLPGPPSECIPMFEKITLPLLKQHDFVGPRFFKNWLLFGVSEGHLSEQLDQLPLTNGSRLGYRIHYPYLEIKVYAYDESSFYGLVKQVEPLIKDHVINIEKIPASEKLIRQIKTTQKKIIIHDEATGGRLENLLLSPSTYSTLAFSHHAAPEALFIHITGLTEYWTQEQKQTVTLKLSVTQHEKTNTHEFAIPFHGRKNILLYAVEFLCRELLMIL